MQSRLVERLRQKDGLSYGAGSQLQISSFEPNTQITLYALFAPQNRDKVQAGVSQEMERLVRDGITEAELVDAQKSLQQQRQTARAQDAILAGLQLHHARAQRTMAFDTESDRQLAALTLAEVNTVLRKTVEPAKLLHVYAGDFAGIGTKRGKESPAPKQ
jgi:zinc protease